MGNFPMPATWVIASAVVLACTSPVFAQESPYVEYQARPIKALSAEQVQDYLDGKGMGLALAAELNAYPGPKHVLEINDQLGIDAERLGEVVEIFGRMQERAKRLGADIVELERRLDQAFKERRVTSPQLESILGRLGQLNGEVRFAHLDAHIQTTALLTDQEIHAYQRLRGYAETAGEGHRHQDM